MGLVIPSRVTLEGQPDGTLLVVADDPTRPDVARMVDWMRAHGARPRVLSTAQHAAMRRPDRLYVTEGLWEREVALRGINPVVAMAEARRLGRIMATPDADVAKLEAAGGRRPLTGEERADHWRARLAPRLHPWVRSLGIA